MNTVQSKALQLHWIKSSYSGGSGGDCIETAPTPSAIHVRDSKDTGQGTFAVTPAAWTAFLGLARQG
ncbi:DUF397 domain-containing protein [Streptomyces sp. NPDC001273]|uniref:DUF397 domain-containing protein n=1 Tax=unclassified Streptomyces TaxID=2593676 RepID=UPI000CD4B744|nr:DUF397 domain-containing protein [Streptomyces sp. SM1]